MLKLIKLVTRILTLIILLGLPLVTSGCIVGSGPQEFAAQALPETRPAPNAQKTLARAFTKTQTQGGRFMFSGWAITKVQKRNNGLYFTGGYDRAKGFNIDGTIFGQPFRYYRWGNDVYISEEEQWRKVAPSQAPLEPFVDFAQLAPLADKAVKLPDEVVLGKKCDVYRFTPDTGDIIKVADTMGLEISADKRMLSQPYFSQAKMKITIWVGQTDSFIYQYKTETNMPVPEAGAMYQEVLFKYWDYNASSVNIQSPDRLQRYLVK